jgi:hypothetical protein
VAELIGKEKLLFALPIEIPNMGKIYQPTLRDFIEKEFDFPRFKRVFSIRKDAVLDDTSKDYDKIKDFDLIVYSNLIEDLIMSLELLYRTDEIRISAKQNNIESIRILIKVNEEIYCLDRNNFTQFANRILILLYSGNNVAEEEVKEELDEIELKILRKKREYERRKNKAKKENAEDGDSIYDIANYLIHVDSKYTYNNVLDLTIYQLINSYYLYRQKENYDVFMAYKTSGQFKIEEKLEHWSSKK